MLFHTPMIKRLFINSSRKAPVEVWLGGQQKVDERGTNG